MNHNLQKGVNVNRQHLLNLNNELAEQHTHYYNGKVKIGTASGAAVVGGEQTPIIDPDERDGWLFKKALAGTAKFNYYFYGQGNKAVTLGELKSVFANVSIDNYQDVSSLPFFNIYTKATGVGDAGVWYHSKITYLIDVTETIMLGEDIELWSINKQTKHHKNKRMVSANTKLVEGDALAGEEIYTITIHSDSSSPALTQILVNNVGYSVVKDGEVNNRRISLV
jgi:hypothetical protein